MTPTTRARLLSRTALALGWLALAFVATVALAADPLPLCDSNLVDDHCKICPAPADRKKCSQWTASGELACQGNAKAEPKVAALAKEEVQRTFTYCTKVSDAYIQAGWLWACKPWTEDGNSVQRPCYRVYSCQWMPGAVSCVRTDQFIEVDPDAYTWTDCFNPYAVTPD